MDRDAIKAYIEKGGEEVLSKVGLDALPEKFYDSFIISGVRIERIEPGRVLCSMKVPPRLVNEFNTLHGGATMSLVDILGSAAILTMSHTTTGVSVEINVSYVSSARTGEEIEIDSKVLRVGKSIAVVSVELRKKATGEIIAQGRHSKYLAASSKL
ncbi:thioesterase superfamily protein [Wolffia australiana]